MLEIPPGIFSRAISPDGFEVITCGVDTTGEGVKYNEGDSGFTTSEEGIIGDEIGSVNECGVVRVAGVKGNEYGCFGGSPIRGRVSYAFKGTSSRRRYNES